MRPQSIVLFERLFLASLVLERARLRAQLRADDGDLARRSGHAAARPRQRIRDRHRWSSAYAIYLLLWYLIARKASNVAKWILVVFTALGVLVRPAGRWPARGTSTLLLGAGGLRARGRGGGLSVPARRQGLARRQAAGRSRHVRLSMRALAALVAALALVPGAAMAQAYQCRVPQGPSACPRSRATGRCGRSPITGYTLALSWSPEYCRGRQDRAARPRQCSGARAGSASSSTACGPKGARHLAAVVPGRAAARPRASSRRNMCMTPVGRAAGARMGQARRLHGARGRRATSRSRASCGTACAGPISTACRATTA